MSNKVTFSKPPNHFTVGRNRKENLFYRQLTAFTDKVKEVVVLRFYRKQPNAITCYACIWVNKGSERVSGGGKTSGCGYNHESAAASEAIYNAGIRLPYNIDSAGDEEIIKALTDIARVASGKRNITVHDTQA